MVATALIGGVHVIISIVLLKQDSMQHPEETAPGSKEASRNQVGIRNPQ